MRKCDSCCKEKKPLKRLSGMLICKECEKERFFECEDCKKRVYIHDLGFHTDKHILCNDCSILYEECMCCYEVLEKDEEYVCKRCEPCIIKSNCPICGETTTKYLGKAFEGEIYCSYCFHQTFKTCYECDGTFPTAQVNTERKPYMCVECMKKCGVTE